MSQWGNITAKFLKRQKVEIPPARLKFILVKTQLNLSEKIRGELIITEKVMHVELILFF